jgi:hypothetical protein
VNLNQFLGDSRAFAFGFGACVIKSSLIKMKFFVRLSGEKN